MTIQRTDPKVISKKPTTNIPTDPIKIITEWSEPEPTDPIIFEEDIDTKK